VVKAYLVYLQTLQFRNAPCLPSWYRTLPKNADNVNEVDHVFGSRIIQLHQKPQNSRHEQASKPRVESLWYLTKMVAEVPALKGVEVVHTISATITTVLVELKIMGKKVDELVEMTRGKLTYQKVDKIACKVVMARVPGGEGVEKASIVPSTMTTSRFPMG